MPRVLGWIVDGTPPFSWTIPDTASSAARMRITVIDLAGNPAVDVSNSVFSIGSRLAAPEPETPVWASALRVYPNPIRRAPAMVEFELPEAARVQLDVFDVQGRRETRLAEGLYPAGRHRRPWDGRDLRGNSVASGIYFVRLETTEHRLIARVLVVR